MNGFLMKQTIKNEQMKDYKIYGNLEFEVDLEDDYLTVVISAGIDVEKDYERYIPSFSMCRNKGANDEKLIFSWDNDEYLYNILYKQVLCPWVENGTIPDAIHFAEFVKEGVHVKDFAKIKELFDVAIAFDFFKNTTKK